MRSTIQSEPVIALPTAAGDVSQLLKTLAWNVAVAAIYFGAGKFGLSLASVNPSASAVWAPTGIAIAVFLLLGYRVWPGILFGAFLTNVTTSGTALTSLAIGAGNMLEGLTGAYLMNRFANGRRAFESPQGVFRFAILAGLGGTMVSATVGVMTLAIAGFAPWANFGPIWLTWWLGDAVGALVVVPVLVLWNLPVTGFSRLARIAEAFGLLLALVLVGQLVFGGLLPFAARNYPLEFLCLPVILWAAFRFSRREAALATLILCGIAIWGTLNGLGPFVRASQNDSLLLLQAFTGMVSVTAVAVGAAVFERSRTQAELQTTNKELAVKVEEARVATGVAREANRLKSEFLSTTSHELRTPLNAMIGFTEIMLAGMGGVIDQDANHMVERIHANSQRLMALINDVLDLSKIEAKRVEVKPRPFAPKQLAVDLQGQIESLAKQKSLLLEVNVDPLLPAQIMGDDGLINRVVVNLLGNAIKFTPRGKISLSLTAVSANTWAVSVQDTGIGIPPHALEYIFDPFRQADGSTQRAFGGTGLGLAIVRDLVRLMDSTVRVESAVGQGSTFTVTLPLSVPQDAVKQMEATA